MIRPTLELLDADAANFLVRLHRCELPVHGDPYQGSLVISLRGETAELKGLVLGPEMPFECDVWRAVERAAWLAGARTACWDRIGTGAPGRREMPVRGPFEMRPK